MYGCATGASIAGQALAGGLMIGVLGASLPLAGAVAFGVGCATGISAGALSEWTVDSLHDKGIRVCNTEDNEGEDNVTENESLLSKEESVETVSMDR